MCREESRAIFQIMLEEFSARSYGVCPKTIMNKGNVVKAGGLLAKKMFEANVWSVGSHIQDNMVPFSTVKGLSSPCEGATHRGSATTHQKLVEQRVRENPECNHGAAKSIFPLILGSREIFEN